MSVIIPGTSNPSNLKFTAGEQVYVEGDLFNICERIKEIAPNLIIRPSMDAADNRKFVINELGEDGIERYVFAVEELDNRVIEKLRYLASVPFEKRYEEAEKQEAKMQREEKEKASDELYESFGRPMWTELERCGFIQRGTSYPKLGVAKPGKAR